MANVYHSELADTSLHYPKGASTASADTWLMANGDGTTSFTSLPDYGLEVTDRLIASSTVDQELTTVGEESQVTFGDAQTTTNGSMSLGADGTVTINEDGLYAISLNLHAGRSTSTGVSKLAFAPRRDGVQIRETSVVALDSSDSTGTTDAGLTGVTSLTAGEQITHHMLYVSGSTGNVGVYTETLSTTGWTDVPSANLNIAKIEVVE